MSTFGGIFSDYLNLPWEQARQFVAEEFEQLRLAISRQWAVAFTDDGTLSPDTILGDKTIVPRYVANTGVKGLTKYLPMWDRVDVNLGVKSKLKFVNFVASTSPSTLVGRGEPTAGDFQQISLGTGLEMVGTTLHATGASFAYIPLATGSEPLQFISDGAGHPILVPFVP